MKVFSLNDMALVATNPEDFIPGAFFNEVALSVDKSTVYIIDTFQPTIWLIHATNLTTAEPEELVTNDILKNPVQPFGLNGLSVAPDDPYLIASVMDRLDDSW
jgi:hypothetical protein